MNRSVYGITVFAVHVLFVFMLLWGCSMPHAVRMVELDLDRLACNIDPSPYARYHNKKVLLLPVSDRSGDTTDLFYYSEDKTVGYRFHHHASPDPQPLASYLWCGLQKVFACAGIEVVGTGTNHDADLALVLHSLTDGEVRFAVDLTRENKYTYSREYMVKMMDAQDGRPDLLEQRAYKMLELMVTAMLQDPEFEQAMLKVALPGVYGGQGFDNLKGMVMKNGKTINGDILNREEISERTARTVQIRTADDNVSSYPIEAVLFFF
jgi:hypothetical protein